MPAAPSPREVFHLPAGTEFPARAADFVRLRDAEASDEQLRQATIALGYVYTDAAIDGLIFGIITDGGSVSAFTESIMRGVASLVEGVAHALIKRVLGKASREVLIPAGDFFRERLVAGDDGVFRIVIPLSAAQGETLATAVETSDKSDLVAALNVIIDSSMTLLYDRAFDVIPIGGMTRKIVETSGRGIRSGASKGAGRAVRSGSPEEVASLVEYIDRRSTLP